MKKRNSNIEFLRIISMILIVLSHYSVHNGILNYELEFGLNRLILEVATLGNIGVILFTLISGYFMIDTPKIKLKKVLRLILQIEFYSVIIYIVCCILGEETFSIINFFKVFLPITFKEYWFATAYIIMYLLTPFINKYLSNLKQCEFRKSLLFMVIWVSILPTFTSMDFYTNEVTQLILFYMLGGYIKKYGLFNHNKRTENFILFISAILIILSIVCIDILGIKFLFFNTHSTYFLNRYSILAILFSIALFNKFIEKPVKENKYINFVSSGIFGIYLIHDNKYLRNVIWIELLKNKMFADSSFLLLHMFGSVFIVFLICLGIELIRKYVIEKKIFKLVDKYIDKFEKKSILIFSKYVE